jgi:hypothetical protein
LNDEAAIPSASENTGWKKAWTAYIGTFFLTLVLLCFVPSAWRLSWLGGLLLLVLVLGFAAYRVSQMMSIRLYQDGTGVWLASGTMPWNKGIRGVKWRDLEGAVYSPTIWSWLFKSYSMRISHRFTKSSEILLSHMASGPNAVSAINDRHEELVRHDGLH